MTEKDIAKNLLLSKNCDTCFHRGIMIHRAERKYDTPKYCIVTKNNTCENWIADDFALDISKYGVVVPVDPSLSPIDKAKAILEKLTK